MMVKIKYDHKCTMSKSTESKGEFRFKIRISSITDKDKIFNVSNIFNNVIKNIKFL